VRRKADGAKELVKEFVGKWRDNEAVIGDVTHTEMKGDQAQLAFGRTGGGAVGRGDRVPIMLHQEGRVSQALGLKPLGM
jgi:hypothetical protein